MIPAKIISRISRSSAVSLWLLLTVSAVAQQPSWLAMFRRAINESKIAFFQKNYQRAEFFRGLATELLGSHADSLKKTNPNELLTYLYELWAIENKLEGQKYVREFPQGAILSWAIALRRLEQAYGTEHPEVLTFRKNLLEQCRRFRHSDCLYTLSNEPAGFGEINMQAAQASQLTGTQIQELARLRLRVVVPTYIPQGFRLTRLQIEPCIDRGEINWRSWCPNYSLLYRHPQTNQCFQIDCAWGGFGGLGMEPDRRHSFNSPIFGRGYLDRKTGGTDWLGVGPLYMYSAEVRGCKKLESKEGVKIVESLRYLFQ